MTAVRRRATAAFLAALLLVSSAALASCRESEQERATEKGKANAALGADTGKGESRVGGSTTICQPKPTVADPPATALPAGISAPAASRVLEVTTQGTGSTVVYETTAMVNDLVSSYKSQIKTAGYATTKTDDEGVEAELYFTVNGKEASVLMRRALCPGGTVRLAIINPG